MGTEDLPVGMPDEQRTLLAEMKQLATEKLASIAAEGPPGRLDRPLIKALGEGGVLPRLFPQDLGGSANGSASAIDLCLIREGLSQGSTSAETAFALQGLGSYPILQAGRDSVRSKWIPRVAVGNAVAAFALTEPDAGTDAGALTVRAERTDGGFVLNGEKKWISNAPEADIYSVFARTTPDAGARGVTAFAVPGSSEGLSGQSLDLLAPHAIGTVVLEDVFVPDESVLGEVDKGFAVAMTTLDLFRPSVGAFAVGMAQVALDAATRHADERTAFGKPLRSMQGISHQIAEAAVRVKAARLLVYEAAATYDAGEHVTKSSAIAKLYATETAQFVIDTALQVFGAQGLERGHLLEHLYRDVRATRIYEGTSEIQREIIARELYL